MNRRIEGAAGAIVLLLVLPGCAVAPSATGSPNQTQNATTTSTSIQPTDTPHLVQPTETSTAPARATPSAVPMTRIPSEPPPSPTGPSADNTASPSPTSPTAASPALSSQQLPVVTAVMADLAKRSGVSVSAISLTSLSSAEWPDGSLGCPRPGIMYSQIVTPGYRIILSAGGQTYEYHTGRGTAFTFCTPAQVK